MNVSQSTRDYKDRIRDYVVDSFLSGGPTAALTDDADLMELLDSLQILRMVADVEKRFSIHVGNDDLTAENFGSVERLAAFIVHKQQGSMDSQLEASAQPHAHSAHR